MLAAHPDAVFRRRMPCICTFARGARDPQTQKPEAGTNNGLPSPFRGGALEYVHPMDVREPLIEIRVEILARKASKRAEHPYWRGNSYSLDSKFVAGVAADSGGATVSLKLEDGLPECP